MNNFEIMVSGFLVGEMEDGSDPYKNDDLHEMMMNADMDSIIISEEDAVAIREAYAEALYEFKALSDSERSELPGDITRKIAIKEKYLEPHYTDIADEHVIVSSNGSLSIEVDFSHTDDVKFSMDSDNGAKIINQGVILTSIHFMKDQNMRQMYLCENAAEARDIIGKLESGSDSIFDNDVKNALMDNDNKLWPETNQLTKTLNDLTYAVSTNKELFKISESKAVKVKPVPEEDSAMDY